MILIDSDILIEVGRGRNQSVAEAWRRVAASETLTAVSPISVAELWHGVRADEEDGLRELFAATVCLPIDAAVGEAAGRYLRRFRKSHGLELADALIGATAAVYALPLWTRNRRHYPMPELAFYEPS